MSDIQEITTYLSSSGVVLGLLGWFIKNYLEGIKDVQKQILSEIKEVNKKLRH